MLKKALLLSKSVFLDSLQNCQYSCFSKRTASAVIDKISFLKNLNLRFSMLCYFPIVFSLKFPGFFMCQDLESDI